MSHSGTGDFIYENQKCYMLIVKSKANTAQFIVYSRDVHDVLFGSVVRKHLKRKREIEMKQLKTS